MKIKQKILVFCSAIINTIVLGSTAYASDCGGYSTSVLPCEGGINGILKLIINILTALIGIAAVGGIIYGSIKYTMSGDSEQKARDAKVFIFNVIAGVVAYGVGYAIINFLIPGGLVPF